MTIADSMREIAIKAQMKEDIERLNRVLLVVDNEIIPTIKEHANKGRLCIWWSFFTCIEDTEIAKSILEDYGFVCKRNGYRLLIKW